MNLAAQRRHGHPAPVGGAGRAGRGRRRRAPWQYAAGRGGGAAAAGSGPDPAGGRGRSGLQRDNYDSRSALEQAVTAGDTALLRELLKAARPDTLQALMRHPTRSPVLLALKQPGADGLAMLRLWVDAGFDLKTLDADAIRQAVSSRNEALAIYLIDAGVPVNPRPPAAADGDGASGPCRRAAAAGRRDTAPGRHRRPPAGQGRRPGRPGLGRAERAVLADRARQSGRAGPSAARRRAPGRSAPAPGAGALRSTPPPAPATLRWRAASRRPRAGAGPRLPARRRRIPSARRTRLFRRPAATGLQRWLRRLRRAVGTARAGGPVAGPRADRGARRDAAVDVLRRLKAGGTDLQAPQEDGERR